MRKIVLCSLFACFVGLGAYADNCPGGFCYIRPAGGGDARARCEDLNEGDDCTYSPTALAKCVNIIPRAGEDSVLSCAAYECKDGYLLWVKANGGSMGICHKESDVIETCKRNGQCGDNCECKPNYIPTPRTRKANGAYQECVCIPKEEPVQPATCDGYTQSDGTAWECCMQKKAGKNVEWNATTGKCECVGDDAGKQWDWTKKECLDVVNPNPTGKKCQYRFDAYVKCGNREIMMHKQYEISEEVAKQLGATGCSDVQKISPQTLMDKDKARFEELRRQWCLDYNDSEVTDAKERLDAFMRSAKMNVSVWKNADGKFNTSRLASDLTAGVVLGTVGGIVSANVIKKKQVEKGFDALNCSVGGQKVADWGDEFTVGLRRY